MASTSQTWVPLARLGGQFDANLSALRGRDENLAATLAGVKPSAEYLLRTQDDLLILGRRGESSAEIQTLSNPVPAARAREIAGKVFPDAVYSQPLMITGLDQGWLWDAMYKLPCNCSFAPGMRFPLYLLAGDVERLWAVLHYQNWSALLADPRVQLAAGPNALADLQRMLEKQPQLCLPRMTVTVEQELWKAGGNLDGLLAAINTASSARLSALQRELAATGSTASPAETAEQFRGGSLRVLGITSRFTTFLQHSMRDWLASLEKLGHTTRLLIEKADHETMPAVLVAEACKEFRPDLILIIDHHRGELPGLPRQTPCVMWIQDRLPNIYNSTAGDAQESGDYVIGYGRQECTRRWGYPGRRFMPSMVGVNESRFAPRKLSESELAEFGCDVSFVSHASMSAERIVEEEIRRSGTPESRRLLTNIYERLREIYDGGGSVTEPSAITKLIEAAMAESQLSGDFQAILDLVICRINNAFLRHQAIGWAADKGVDLRLYGRGWETHPRFSRFARGVADNQTQLSLIYQASRVNLQVTPFGAAHQRVFEGLACGGFFLLRSVTGDAIELLSREVWRLLRRHGVNDGTEMMRRCGDDPTFQWLISGIAALGGANPLSDPHWFYAGIEEAAMGGFSRGAGTLWPEYERVSFWTQSELGEKLDYFLSSDAARQTIMESMRQQVLRWHTYTAISRRLLSFIADDLSGQKRPAALAA